jgi:division protein CdvB (Snf7/Vps24/ESCRT-III family)
MAQFETMFDNLGVQAEIMDQVMDNVQAGSYAEKDVSSLINQVAEENNMKVSQEFESVGLGSSSLKVQAQQNKDNSGKVGVQMNK